MIICLKILQQGSAVLTEPDELFAPDGTTVQGNKAPNLPGSATSESLAPASAFLQPTKEIFKQFIQTYMNSVWSLALPQAS